MLAIGRRGLRRPFISSSAASVYSIHSPQQYWLSSRCHSTAPEAPRSGGLDRLRGKRAGRVDPFALPKTPARTRFAPSPTGYLHLGSLRTALYNYLMARATGGQFIIRVEDTDRTRIVHDAEERLFDDLKWAQLDWDEAPDVGGPFGPYRQSDRLHHYHQHADQLLASGKAYRCFCSSHDLEKHKEHAATNRLSTNYPGTCRSIPLEEAEQRAASGETHVIRFKAEGTVPIVDRVYGRYTKNEEEDDFILIKSDKYPTYHFANVVDDHLMEITHVIRGAEWLISTPKHVALYNAFGWTPPEFGHVGLLTDHNGHKLSKRNQDIDISSYRRQGVLPSALNNWVALLGWSMGSGQNEVVKNLEELVKKFSFKFTKGNIQVNMQKLETFEHRHLTSLLKEKPLNMPLLTTALLDPMYDAITQLDATARPAHHGALLPAFSDRAAATAYMLRIFQANTTKYPRTIDVLTQNPSLLWSIPPGVYAAHLAQNAQPMAARAREAATLRALRAALGAVPGAEWTQTQLASVLGDFVAREKEQQQQQQQQQQEAGGEVNPMAFVHGCLRFALVGGFNLPSKASSVALALLGREEALKRVDAAVQAYEQL